VLVLGSRDLDPAAAHARLHEYALVGVPAYEPRDCDEAARSHADFALVGPVYVRDSSSVSASGLDLVRAAARSLPVHDEAGTPWFAVGGITPQRIDAVIDGGARRAGIVVSGEQDLDAVRQVATALRTSWESEPEFADFAFRVLSGPTRAAGLASRQEPTTW